MELTIDTRSKTHATTALHAPRARLWTGRVLTGLAVAFMLFDSAGKLLRLDPVLRGTAELGYQTSAILPIGLMLLACVVLHLVPRTAVLGAVLLTGYLGGAVASQLRLGNPLLTHTLFPIYFAALVWGGLYLRDGRVRGLLAPRQR
jgi:hypothetical protein